MSAAGEAVALRGVTVRFGDRTVLDRLDLELDQGKVTALTGPNGSGKTTVGRLLLGLLAPHSGAVESPGRGQRSAVFQEDRLCEQLSAVANVRLALGRSVPATEVLADLRRVGLDPAALTQPVRELSGGQRRRVTIVRALMTDARLLVLDEPFTGLDVEGRPAVLEYVRERCVGRTTLLITHDDEDVAWFGARRVTLPAALGARVVTAPGAPAPARAPAPALGAPPREPSARRG